MAIRSSSAQFVFAVAIAAITVAACATAGSTSAPSAEPLPSFASSSTPAVSQQPSSPTAPSPALSALVGTWDGVHECGRILDVLTAAGMPQQALLNIVDAGTLPGVTTVAQIADPANPCANAVPIRHAHFFRANGEFGSLDAAGQQVDDGQWQVVDATTMTISGVPFGYSVMGDKLELRPIDVGTCPDSGEWCEEAWKLMVAMPGLTWTRRR